MSWKTIYKSRLVSADEAVKNIKSGDRVVLSHAVAEPLSLVDALIRNKALYKDVEIVHLVAMGKGEYTKPEMIRNFRHNALFVGSVTRDAIAEGRADYTPCFFFEVPSLFKNGCLPIDVALIQVSPPDEHGYCSFGVSNDYTKPAAEIAKIVIAQINPQMPKTLGDTFIHITKIDHIVEFSNPIIELQPATITQVEETIGENCASLIEDGSTLQLGIGAIPDAVLLFLKNKKDLGIHSEMISDGIIDLVEQGVITNNRKTIHKGKIVVTFIMGTKKLYDFVNNNPLIEMHPVDYVNNPKIIMQNYRMVSINSCVQVDLMGQVSSESIGLKQISGVGGQVDFVRGAAMGTDGKSIIAMPSTASGGKISRIVPTLDYGAAVTTTRNDVHYIITEYGIADLKGKTLKQRAELLIGISHPSFRDELVVAFEKRFKSTYVRN